MTQPRDAYHHGDLRNALVASAVRLIEASGPGAFSLREAAREVGVSASAAYRHFDDKVPFSNLSGSKDRYRARSLGIPLRFEDGP